MRICTRCVVHPALQRLIEKKGKVITQCRICGGQDVNAIDVKNATLGRLFKALVRYFYAEWDYNTHWGGSGLEELFYQQNSILRWGPEINQDALEGAILALREPAYASYRKGISLYAGHGSDGPNPPLQSLQNDESEWVVQWMKDLSRRSQFEVAEEVIAKLRPLRKKIAAPVKKGESFYRARLGYDFRGMPTLGDAFAPVQHYRPHTGKNIGSAPAKLCTPGRMNRGGVPFLYVASEPKTAVAEIRPHPGHFVSLGQFRCVKGIEVADVTSLNIEEYCASDAELDVFLFLRTLDGVFSRPLPPEMRDQYVLTQLIADVLWRLGFDGIRFRSSVSDGFNLALFDPSCFEYVEDGAKVVRVTGLKYAYDDLPLADEPGDCLMARREDGTPLI